MGSVTIPMGRRGRATCSAPNVLYHSLRRRELVDGSIKGYPLSAEEIELADMFPEPSTDGYVWLSQEPYSKGALAIDTTKLDPANLRFTMQSEGFLIHKGSIPSSAIIKQVTETMNLYNLSNNPEQLPGYDKQDEVPELAWEKYGLDMEKSHEFKSLWAKFPKFALNYAFTVLGKRFPAGEAAIATDALSSYDYARKVLCNRFPEGEAAIATNPHFSFYYAWTILKGRFPAGEAAIATNPGYSYLYALKVLRGRFPAGEAIILDSPQNLRWYVQDILNKHFTTNKNARSILKKAMVETPVTEAMNLYKLSATPKELPGYDKRDEIPLLAWEKHRNHPKIKKRLEHIWAKDPKTACEYAEYTLRKRFPAGEAAIATSAFDSLRYARFVLDDRFRAGEAAIMTNPEAAVEYANHILTRRWPAAEPIIATEVHSAYEYAYSVLNGPFPAGEAAISTDPSSAYSYASELLGKRFPAGEAAIATQSSIAYRYAHYVLQGRFPIAELVIAKDPAIAFLYVKYVLKNIRVRTKKQAQKYILDLHEKPVTEAMNLYSLSANPEELPNFDKMLEIPTLAWKHCEDKMSGGGRRDVNYTANKNNLFVQLEHTWEKDPQTAYKYAMFVIRRPFPAGEAIIATDAKYSLYYAKNVLHRPWPKGEPAIANDPRNYVQLDYARSVLKGPFPAGEAGIAKDPYHIMEYANHCLHGRFLLGEITLLEQARTGYYYFADQYLHTIVKGRWPEYEKLIINTPHACHYARIVFKGRWPEAEPAIASDVKTAFSYATTVLKQRWEPAEKTLLQSTAYGLMAKYAAVFGFRWPEVEEKILKLKRFNPIINYAKQVIKGAWPEGEKVMLERLIATRNQDNYPSGQLRDWAHYYIATVLKDKTARNIVFGKNPGPKIINYFEKRVGQVNEDVKFDNRAGWGNTPNNAEIDYFGFIVMMRPSMFLKLAAPLPRDQAPSTDKIKQHLEAGGTISNPTLYVTVPSDWRYERFDLEDASIMMHEGRNRMYAMLEINGDEYVETHIFLRSDRIEWRSKLITPAIIQQLNRGAFSENHRSYVLGPLFKTKK